METAVQKFSQDLVNQDRLKEFEVFALQKISDGLTAEGKIKDYGELTVESESDEKHVSSICLLMTKELKEIEKRRMPFTDPLEKFKKRIIAGAKDFLLPRKGLLNILNPKILAWHASQDAIRRKAEEAKKQEALDRLEDEKNKQLEAAMNGDEKAGEAVEEIDKNRSRLEEKEVVVRETTTTDGGRSATTTYWDINITDKTKVPEEYKTVNEVALRSLARNLKENFNVPGVEAVQKKRMSHTSLR